jgi:hypothetical protein
MKYLTCPDYGGRLEITEGLKNQQRVDERNPGRCCLRCIIELRRLRVISWAIMMKGSAFDS